MNKKAKCSAKVCGLLCFLLLSLIPHDLWSVPQGDARITLELKNATLETAIESIKEQSAYLFLNKDVNLSRTVSLSVKGETIENTCKALFTPLGIEYRVEEHHIFLFEPEPVAITGRVTDAAGNPVPGAAVIEKGTSNGTVTGPDGTFSMTVTGGGKRY